MSDGTPETVADDGVVDDGGGDPVAGTSDGPSRPARLFGGLWRYGVGSVLCWFAVGAVMVVGWTQRSTRRFILWRWWRCSPWRRQGGGFGEFLRGDDRTAEHLRPPRWCLGVPWTDSGGRRWFGGLGRNLSEGLATSVNVLLYTLPAGALWAVGWFIGWEVSFHKAYEQLDAGRLLFLAGMLLFIPAMHYVPLAQARQASTGEMASFHQVRFIVRLLRQRWMAVLGLVAAHFALGLMVMVLRAAPFGLGNTPWMDALDPQRQLWLVQGYHLAGCFLVFPAYVGLRLLAGAVYAGAIREGVRRGSVTREDLTEFEWNALERLGLDRRQPFRPDGWLLHALRWTGSRSGRLIAGVAVVGLWLAMTWQVLLAEFFNYHRFGRGWWNQPLLQLPWFDYTPWRLYRAAGEWRRNGNANGPVPELVVPVPGAEPGSGRR